MTNGEDAAGTLAERIASESDVWKRLAMQNDPANGSTAERIVAMCEANKLEDRFCPACGADVVGNDPHEPACRLELEQRAESILEGEACERYALIDGEAYLIRLPDGEYMTPQEIRDEEGPA